MIEPNVRAQEMARECVARMHPIDNALNTEAQIEHVAIYIAAAAADARRQAIEECLRLCENQPISPPYSPAVMRFQCADAIRALLPPAPEEGG